MGPWSGRGHAGRRGWVRIRGGGRGPMMTEIKARGRNWMPMVRWAVGRGGRRQGVGGRGRPGGVGGGGAGGGVDGVVAGAAELGAEDRVDPGGGGDEVDVEGLAGDGVLFETELRDGEAVDDVLGVESKVYFAVCGEDEFGGDFV